ncbi:hypothetical protein CUU64_12280 [Bacillus sp. V5-8f]|nr:hypothetical protein CUU64_12280 [Bacillus sp. V5-8f]
MVLNVKSLANNYLQGFSIHTNKGDGRNFSRSNKKGYVFACDQLHYCNITNSHSFFQLIVHYFTILSYSQHNDCPAEYNYVIGGLPLNPLTH